MMILEEELYKFKEEVLNNYIKDPNRCIYLRLSKLDNSKNKDESIKEALMKLRSDFNNLLEKYPELEKDGFSLFVEVKSAYKKSTREEFLKMCDDFLFSGVNKVSDILESVNIPTEKKSLYLVSFDRASRVFMYGLLFHVIRKFRDIDVFTLMDEQNDFEERNMNILNESNLNQTMYVFQLILFSSQAEQHSEDLSNKIKNRVDKNDKGETISNKTGKLWGAKKTISDTVRKRIVDRSERFNVTDISNQKDIYQVIGGKRYDISINTIYKIISKNK